MTFLEMRDAVMGIPGAEIRIGPGQDGKVIEEIVVFRNGRGYSIEFATPDNEALASLVRARAVETIREKAAEL